MMSIKKSADSIEIFNVEDISKNITYLIIYIYIKQGQKCPLERKSKVYNWLFIGAA